MFRKIQSLFIHFAGWSVFLVLGSIALLFSFIIPNSVFFFARPISWIFLTVMGVRLNVKGEFPKDGTFIIMYNHESFIDPFLLPIFSKGKFTGIIAKENLDVFLFGTLLKRFNVVPIDRKNSKSAIEAVNSVVNVINEGYHIVILPEGTRTLDGKMKSFKKGGFHLAINSQTPILPVGIQGAYDFKPKNRKLYQPGKVVMNIGKPILPEEYVGLGLDGLTEKTRIEIQQLIDEK